MGSTVSLEDWKGRQNRGGDGSVITPEQIEAFLESLKGKGHQAGTVQAYRRSLRQFYAYLSENKWVRAGTAAQWRASLLEQGYTPRTVNAALSAVNNFLGFIGLEQYRLARQLRPLSGARQPELTRNEYLRLLSAARALGKQRTYLLIKIFACTSLTVEELPKLTAQAVHEGRTSISANANRRIVHIPGCLRDELLDYIQQEHILSGPVFLARSARPVDRTVVTAAIQSLAHDARVPSEKCNIRCLHRLYQCTQQNILASFSPLVEQAHERLLESEQPAIGWEAQGQV